MDRKEYIESKYQELIGTIFGSSLFGELVDVGNQKEMLVAAYYFGEWKKPNKPDWIVDLEETLGL